MKDSTHQSNVYGPGMVPLTAEEIQRFLNLPLRPYQVSDMNNQKSCGK